MRLRRTVRQEFVRGLLAVGVLALAAAPAAASLMRFLPVEELAQESSLVVRARIVRQSVHWTANHEGIYTVIEAVATGDLKGTAPGIAAGGGRRLTIIQAGGEIDGVSLDWTGRPVFRDGEDLVLFLQAYEPADPADGRLLVVGGKQGRMRVIEDPSARKPALVERDLAGVLDAPFIEGAEPTEPAPRRDQMTLDDLTLKVRSAGGGGR